MNPRTATTRRTGSVTFASTADRPGERTKPIVVNFLGELAARAGPVVVGTGTNHNRLTVNGRVSDHWDGHAADVKARGRRLILLGQQALILAGMNPRKAREQTGGLYNLYRNGRRIQIIFNTAQGGDHYDHLHVGIR